MALNRSAQCGELATLRCVEEHSRLLERQGEFRWGEKLSVGLDPEKEEK